MPHTLLAKDISSRAEVCYLAIYKIVPDTNPTTQAKKYVILVVVSFFVLFILYLLFDDLGIYIKDVLSHWLLIMSGVVSVTITFYEKIRDSMSKYALYAIALICVFFAGFQAWQDQYRGRLESDNKLIALTIPKLTAEITGVDVGTPPNKLRANDSLIAVWVRFRNLGAPTIVDKFYLEAILKDGRRVTATQYSFGHTLRMENAPLGSAYRKNEFAFDSAEYLVRKVTETPIPTNGGAVGWIDGVLIGIPREQIKTIILNFADINTKRYSIEQVLGQPLKE